MGSGALPGPDLLAIPGASKVEGQSLEGGVSQELISPRGPGVDRSPGSAL